MSSPSSSNFFLNEPKPLVFSPLSPSPSFDLQHPFAIIQFTPLLLPKNVHFLTTQEVKNASLSPLQVRADQKTPSIPILVASTPINKESKTIPELSI